MLNIYSVGTMHSPSFDLDTNGAFNINLTFDGSWAFPWVVSCYNRETRVYNAIFSNARDAFKFAYEYLRIHNE